MFNLIKTQRVLAFIALLCCGTWSVQGQGIATPRDPSPAASVSQTIGISTVKVNYSRPSVRGREIWGKLVPYGWNVDPGGYGLATPAPWRAGANENTVLSLSHPATIEGHAVPAGSYGLFFVINQDNATGEVILSRDYKSWGSYWYDPAQDAMREKINLREGPQTEVLTYDFEHITPTGAELVLSWEKKQFPVKIEFAVKDIVMANAAEELKGPLGFTAAGYLSAARYSLQSKADPEQGLKWVDQSIRMNPNFAAYDVKANLLKLLNRTDEARQVMKDAEERASENELNQYGYQLLNRKQIDEAIAVFQLNTQRNPKSANVWDSLGEAYAIKGDKKNAILNFKKSLSLNPPPDVKANSEKYLQQLNAR
jgi:hypothetical protein